MSNKTTAILTFLVSTVIPFIQEVVDFISMFRTGTYDKSGSESLRSISLAMQDDLVNMQKREVKADSASFCSADRQEEKPYSRFLGKTH